VRRGRKGEGRSAGCPSGTGPGWRWRRGAFWFIRGHETRSQALKRSVNPGPTTAGAGISEALAVSSDKVPPVRGLTDLIEAVCYKYGAPPELAGGCGLCGDQTVLRIPADAALGGNVSTEINRKERKERKGFAVGGAGKARVRWDLGGGAGGGGLPPRWARLRFATARQAGICHPFRVFGSGGKGRGGRGRRGRKGEGRRANRKWQMADGKCGLADATLVAKERDGFHGFR